MSWSLTPLDPSEDWDLWDGVETVHYYRFISNVDDGDYYDDYVEMLALFREVQATNVPIGEGETTTAQVLITLPFGNAFGGVAPRRFDKIERQAPVGPDTQPVYIVQYHSLSTLGTRVKCWCTKSGAGRLT